MKILIDYDIKEHIGSGACQHVYIVDEETEEKTEIPLYDYEKLLHGKKIVDVDYNVEYVVIELED